MKNKSALLIFILALFYGGISLHAQYRRPNRIITTDYNECLIGVKDSSGRWVIQPKYETIERTYQERFIVSVASKRGVIDSNGTVLLPMMYNQVQPTPLDHLYEVRIGNKWGVVDITNRLVVPIVYRRVDTNSDTTFFVLEKKKKWKLMHTDGSVQNLPWRSSSAPSEVGNHIYKVTKHRFLLKNQYGLIDDSAHVVVPRTYDGIIESGASDLIVMRKGRKVGYLSAAGETVWPVAFQCQEKVSIHTHYEWSDNSYFYMIDPIFYNDTVGIAMLGDKYGLVSISGRTILPFEYDFIDRIESSDEHSSITWEVERKDKVGLYNLEQGWTANMEYDYIEPITSYEHLHDSTGLILFAGRKNGLYGVATTNGQVIIPFVFSKYNDNLFTTTFYSADSLVVLNRSGYLFREQLVREIVSTPNDSVTPEYRINPAVFKAPTGGKFSSWSDGKQYSVYYNSSYAGDTIRVGDRTFTIGNSISTSTGIPDDIILHSVIVVQTLKPTRFMTGGDLLFDGGSTKELRAIIPGMFVLHAKDSSIDEVYYSFTDSAHTYYQTRREFVFRDDGKILFREDEWYTIRVAHCSHAYPILFLLRGNNNRKAVADTAGNYVVQPQKNGIGPFTDKYIWINSRPRRDNYNTFFKPRWKLIDRSTGKVVFGKRNAIRKPGLLWGDLAVMDSDHKGTRLYNIPGHQYVTPVGFNNIEGINDSNSLFMVRTCSQKTGIIDQYGHFVIDTIWKYCTPLDYNGSRCEVIDDDGHQSHSWFYRYMVFYNDTGSVLFDVERQIVTGDSVARQYLFESMIALPDSMDTRWLSNNYYGAKAFRGTDHFVTYSSDSSEFREWQIQSMLDTLCGHKRYTEGRHMISEGQNIYNCKLCRKQTDTYSYMLPYSTGNTYVINYRNDSLLSYCSFADRNQMMWQTNIMMFPDGPHQMTLDSLFDPARDWKNFVINAVMSYINSHLYIRGDCHNPAAFPSMLNNRFLITERGIELYPTDFFEMNLQLIVTVPWKDADPYLRNDIRSRLPLIPEKK